MKAIFFAAFGLSLWRTALLGIFLASRLQPYVRMRLNIIRIFDAAISLLMESCSFLSVL